MGRPDEGELLRFIAEREALSATCEHFRIEPELVRELLRAAAERAPKPRKKPEQAALQFSAAPAAAPATLSKVRVYSDGASRGNPGPAGAGAVIMNADSGEVVELLKRFLGKQTNNVAEYQAAILGLARARELGALEVELVADSQLLIRQLGGQYQVKHPGIRPLYEEALQLLKGFQKVRLVHVPREMNTLADEMSNKAIDDP